MYVTHTGKDISRFGRRLLFPIAADLVTGERNENIFIHKGHCAYETPPTFVYVCHHICSQPLLRGLHVRQADVRLFGCSVMLWRA